MNQQRNLFSGCLWHPMHILRGYCMFLRKTALSKQFKWLFGIYLLAVLYLVQKSAVKGPADLLLGDLSQLNIDMDSVPEPAIRWDFEDKLLSPTTKFRNITILMWTQYYHNKDLTDHIKNESPIPDWCNVTFNKSKLSESDAVVFHASGSDLNIKDLPKRDIDQPWVFYIIESPVYSSRDFEPLNPLLFNRTMTYRIDSDFPCLYGYVRRRKTALAQNPYYTSSFPKKSKTNFVAWMVSHCSTSSQREKIVEKMQKLIPVDVYGGCGDFQCKRRDEEGCYNQLGLKYKFYLSFENSLCTDYITEKFSNALKYNMVPIVYGGGNYSKILPYQKSFINIDDFDSMPALAEYLNYLNENETAYAEYFEWRRFYDLKIRQGFSGFRRMCFAMQDDDWKIKKSYSNIKKWWLEGHSSRPKHPFTKS